MAKYCVGFIVLPSRSSDTDREAVYFAVMPSGIERILPGREGLAVILAELKCELATGGRRANLGSLRRWLQNLNEIARLWDRCMVMMSRSRFEWASVTHSLFGQRSIIESEEKLELYKFLPRANP